MMTNFTIKKLKIIIITIKLIRLLISLGCPKWRAVSDISDSYHGSHTCWVNRSLIILTHTMCITWSVDDHAHTYTVPGWTSLRSFKPAQPPPLLSQIWSVSLTQCRLLSRPVIFITHRVSFAESIYDHSNSHKVSMIILTHTISLADSSFFLMSLSLNALRPLPSHIYGRSHLHKVPRWVNLMSLPTKTKSLANSVRDQSHSNHIPGWANLRSFPPTRRPLLSHLGSFTLNSLFPLLGYYMTSLAPTVFQTNSQDKSSSCRHEKRLPELQCGSFWVET